MKPGLHRAVPFAIGGFAIGALLVMVIRGLQSLDPLFDPQLGFIMAGFMSAGFFIWGMGGFNPEMSTHPHEPETDETGLIIAEPEDHEDVIEEPRRAFFFSVWQISFLTIITMVVLLGFASIPNGFFLRISNDEAASTIDVGYDTVELPFDGPEIEVSQLSVFVGFIAFTVFSLAVVGGIISAVFFGLSNRIEHVRANEDYPIETIPNPTSTPTSMAINLAAVAVLFIVLYIAFYYVLIGFVLPNPEELRVLLSVVNALVIAIVIVYPLPVLRLVGKAAGWLATVLRDLPSFLFQR